MDLYQYFTDLQQSPETLLPLLVLVFMCFIALKWFMGGFSRQAWYQESRIRSKISAGSATAIELKFVENRNRARWTYRLLPLLLVVSHPFYQNQIDEFYSTLWPFVQGNWLLLILIGIALIALRTISAIMNLNQLAKDVEKQRNS